MSYSAFVTTTLCIVLTLYVDAVTLRVFDYYSFKDQTLGIS